MTTVDMTTRFVGMTDGHTDTQTRAARFQSKQRPSVAIKQRSLVQLPEAQICLLVMSDWPGRISHDTN